MLLSIVSGLVVSVDAFFIGLSLGLQQKCRFYYIAAINLFLFALCMAGFFLAGRIYERLPFDPDIIVGAAFILLGVWTMLQYFLRKAEISKNTVLLVGLIMSGEAMLVTMGVTFIFQPYATLAIPLTVAAAHFAYCTLAFYLVRTKHARRIPIAASHVISGLALVAYGVFALL